MQITFLENGSTIYFTGNDNVDDTKGLIDDKYPIKLVVIDELTEFFEQGDGDDEIQNIKATFVRGNDDYFTTLYLFNPPKNPEAPVMKWLADMKLRPNFKHVQNGLARLLFKKRSSYKSMMTKCIVGCGLVNVSGLMRLSTTCLTKTDTSMNLSERH